MRAVQSSAQLRQLCTITSPTSNIFWVSRSINVHKRLTKINEPIYSPDQRRSCSHCLRPDAEPAAASAAPLLPPQADHHYMRLALHEAQLAYDAGEVPVGAVLVDSQGSVVAAAGNSSERSSDPTAHAEMLCLRAASQRQGGWRLIDSTLYVTLEPCPMCAGAVLQSRVGRVVYGAKNPLLGADGSWIDMLRGVRSPAGGAGGVGREEIAAEGGKEENNGGDISSSFSSSSNGDGDRRVAPLQPHPFHRGMEVEAGVLEGECGAIMKDFFKERRRQQKAAKEEQQLLLEREK